METVVTTLSGLMGSCAADFFSGTPTHAAEPSSARIAKLRQEINSRTPLMPTVGDVKLAAELFGDKDEVACRSSRSGPGARHSRGRLRKEFER